MRLLFIVVPFFCYFMFVYCVENQQFCDGEKKDKIDCDGEKIVKQKKDVLVESKLPYPRQYNATLD